MLTHSETLELSLASAGLGRLRENAVLKIFADAQARRLMAPGRTLRDLVDEEGRALYPAFYWTKLEASAQFPLQSMQTWDRIAVSADVVRYGSFTLSSRYSLSRTRNLEPGQTGVGESPITMSAGSMFVLDHAKVEPEAVTPLPAVIAKLPTARGLPDGLAEFRTARTTGLHGRSDSNAYPLSPARPYSYLVMPHRDASPGQSVMFADYALFMDCAEYQFLCRELRPAIPTIIYDAAHLVQRECFYFYSIGCHSDLQIESRYRLSAAPQVEFADGSVAKLLIQGRHEIVDRGTGRLVMCSTADKIVRLPAASAAYISECERLLVRHAAKNMESPCEAVPIGTPEVVT